MATEREYSQLLARFERLEDEFSDLKERLDKLSGFMALMPWVALIVTGLAGLGTLVLR